MNFNANSYSATTCILGPLAKTQINMRDTCMINFWFISPGATNSKRLRIEGKEISGRIWPYGQNLLNSSKILSPTGYFFFSLSITYSSLNPTAVHVTIVIILWGKLWSPSSYPAGPSVTLPPHLQQSLVPVHIYIRVIPIEVVQTLWYI